MPLALWARRARGHRVAAFTQAQPRRSRSTPRTGFCFASRTARSRSARSTARAAIKRSRTAGDTNDSSAWIAGSAEATSPRLLAEILLSPSRGHARMPRVARPQAAACGGSSGCESTSGSRRSLAWQSSGAAAGWSRHADVAQPDRELGEIRRSKAVVRGGAPGRPHHAYYSSQGVATASRQEQPRRPVLNRPLVLGDSTSAITPFMVGEPSRSEREAGGTSGR